MHTRSRFFDLFFTLTVTGGLSMFSSVVLSQEKENSTRIKNSLGMELVLIQPGSFNMGSPPTERGSRDNETLHKVRISRAYYLAKTEVSWAQWVEVMEEDTRTVTEEIRDPNTKRLIKSVEKQVENPRAKSPRPATGVSWDDAVKFCEKLSLMPEEKNAGRVYRLPTEAEWEYAARGGTQTPYCCGDNPECLMEFAWFKKTAYYRNPEDFPMWKGRTHDVGSKRANPWGIHDMHGNVAEWCSDWYGPYEEGVVTDPSGPESEYGERIIRGGAVSSEAEGCRSAARYCEPAKTQDQLIGFRVAFTASDSEQSDKTP